MAKFVKGQSGNPRGRPKGSKDVTALARQYSEEAIEILVYWMRQKRSPAASVGACRAVLAKVLPDLKAVEHSGEINHLHQLTDADLDQRIAELGAQIGISFAASGAQTPH